MKRPAGARGRVHLLAVMPFLAAAGCRSSAPTPAAPASRAEGLGAVRYEAIVDPAAPKPRLAATQELSRPLAGDENRLPVYPPGLLALDLPPYFVALRFVVGTDGCVGQIGPSPLAPTTQGPEAESFIAAAEQAVSTWRYLPGAVRTFGPGPDVDGDGRPDWKVLESATPQRFYFDVGFVFEVVRGRAVVSQR